MKAIFYGIAVLGGLVSYESIKGLQAAQASAPASSAAPSASSGAAVASAPSIGSNLDWILSTAQAATGVSGWGPGLQQILAQENPGLSPNIQNPIAVGGEHATGLFQTLPSTFQANAQGSCTDIVNPLCNAEAAINYIRREYGSPSNIPNLGTSAYGGY